MCKVILFIVVHFCHFAYIFNTFSHLILLFFPPKSADFIVISFFLVYLFFFSPWVNLAVPVRAYFGKKPSWLKQVISWNHLLGYAILSARCLLENCSWNHGASLSRYNLKLYAKIFIANQELQNCFLSLLLLKSRWTMCMMRRAVKGDREVHARLSEPKEGGIGR